MIGSKFGCMIVCMIGCMFDCMFGCMFGCKFDAFSFFLTDMSASLVAMIFPMSIVGCNV